MKLPESTEWALHAVASLAQLEPGSTASAAQLAEYFDLPPAYLAKQLQSLVRAGVLAANTGPRGGFRLARPADQVTMLDIVEAIDGSSAPYVCRELRQQGTGAAAPEECRETCFLAARMADAHEAWRGSLRAVTIADVHATLPPAVGDRTRVLLERPGR